MRNNSPLTLTHPSQWDALHNMVPWASLSSLTASFPGSVCGVGAIKAQGEMQCQIPLLCQPEQLLKYAGGSRGLFHESKIWFISHSPRLLKTLVTKSLLPNYSHKEELTSIGKADRTLPPRAPSFNTAGEICHLQRAGGPAEHVGMTQRVTGELAICASFSLVSELNLPKLPGTSLQRGT